MLIKRHHQNLLSTSSATYSDCENYRYSLRRTWDSNGMSVVFVMLNPSTATEVENDPTVERCERRARAMGFGAFEVVNIFAYRATDPKVMRRASDPIGAQNDVAILAAANWADRVICAWGAHGAHLGRGTQVADLLKNSGFSLYHFGLSQSGAPKHPLYINYGVQPILWV